MKNEHFRILLITHQGYISFENQDRWEVQEREHEKRVEEDKQDWKNLSLVTQDGKNTKDRKEEDNWKEK